MDNNEVTIFDRIVSGQIKADIVYQDDQVLAFNDIDPQAPIHILLIPKHRNGLTQLSKAEPKNKELLGDLMLAVGKIVNIVPELKNGFRIVINDGQNSGQTVWHLHLHIIGGEKLTWPPGSSGSKEGRK